MTTTLNEIIENKEKEVGHLIEREKKNRQKTLEAILKKHQKNHHLFKNALKVAGLSIIAEIKRKSPSKGEFSKIEDPVKLAHLYSKSGAAAISVLTDAKYFGGSLDDLQTVANALESLHPCPVLQKDFIIHPYQIAQAKKMGASAVLLIVAVLKDELKKFLELASYIGLDALVEVHNENELQIAIEAKSQIIAVNNTDLQTFEVNLDVAKNLAFKIPKGIIKVADSGISSIEDAHSMHKATYDGILVGEMLIKSKDPGAVISEMGNV